MISADPAILVARPRHRTAARAVSPPVRYQRDRHHYLVISAGLTWIMIMAAAELRTPTWTRAGAKLAFGNRETLPPASPVAARAALAAHNMLENMVLFVALFAANLAVGTDPMPGAAIFTWARIAYFPVYLAGIVYVRSALWVVSLVGLGWMAWSAV
ncbi:MAG: MAPEG family protein [Kofleriaceae bacterium]